MELLIFLGTLFLFMCLGIPLALVLVICAMVLMFHSGMWDTMIIPTSMLDGANNYPLMAIPFFVFAGEIMAAGGLSKRVVALAQLMVGRIRGGLGYAAIVACIVVVDRRSLRRGMRPLQAILAWLDAYRLGERNKEMPQNTSVTEFRRLGEAISRTTKRNEALFEEQKRFTANASHELQTPLAVIQSRLEMLLDDGQLTEQQMGEVVKALHTLKALARTNRSLLLLSKIAGGQFTSTEAVSMAGTVDRLLPDMEMIYAHKGITVERRNDDDLHSLFRLLSDYNISLIYTNGPNFDQTPDGEYMKRISVANAVFERELASRRVADKYIEALKRGIMSGARRPLGYISGNTPGSAVIDKNASLIVQRIFALCLEGKPPSEIAILANREFGGIPVRKFKNGKCDSGGKFTENKIRSIILNPFYAGYVYATISGYGTIDVKYKLYDGIHKAIISKDEWKNAVYLLKSNRREKNAYPSIRKADAFILKKYLRCECGAHMTVASSGKKARKGEIYRYYACTRKKHLRGGCDCKTHIPLNIIEPIVFASIGYFFKDDAKGVGLEDDKSEYINQTRSKLEILKKEFKKLDANLNTQLGLLASFDANQAVKENIEGKIRKLGNELEENRVKRIKFEEDLKLMSLGKNISDAKINSAFEDLYELQANLSEEEKREILSLCVEKIVLKCLTKRVGSRGRCA